MGFWKRLKEKLFGTEEEILERKKAKLEAKNQKKLLKPNTAFNDYIKEVQNKHNKIDEEFFEDLEEALILSDISANLVNIIIDECKKEVKAENIDDPKLISEIIADKLVTIYTMGTIIDSSLNIQDGRLNIILVVGVNGSGKTTSIAKIAHKLIKENK